MNNTYTIDIFNALGFPKAINKDFNNSNDLKNFTMNDIVEQYKEDLKSHGLKVDLSNHKIVISLCSVLRENIDNSIKELLKNDNNLDTTYINKTINNFNQKGA
tara:strand:- start:124 stop:432 length:309 start_codon:yes stop_codon:yes gene_type:complete